MKSKLAVLSGDKQMAGDLYTSADTTLHLSLERPVLPRLVLGSHGGSCISQGGDDSAGFQEEVPVSA